MIRLYTEEPLAPGSQIKLSSQEQHYFERVRRGRGRVEIFNRQGQVASGQVESGVFIVEKIEEVLYSALPIRMAVALPESALLKTIVAQASELGMESLYFFAGERSQSANKRKESIFKLERAAIEAARQCGRSRPIEIKWWEWDDLLTHQAELKVYLDESPESNLPSAHSTQRSALVVVGCEGGWSPAEREKLKKAGFHGIHFPTPVLRVETAAVIAAFWALLQCSPQGGASNL